MMRDKDPERGINSEGRAEKRSVVKGQDTKKKWEREEGEKKKRHININNLSLSEREREGKEERLNREMNLKQTEMEGGE